MWSLVYFLVGILPSLVLTASMLPDLTRAVDEATRAAGAQVANADDIEAALGRPGRIIAIQIVQFVGMVVAVVLLYGAIFRAVFEPDNDAYWYLRVSAQEGWLALVSIVSSAIFVIAVVCALIPILGIGFALGVLDGEASTLNWILFGGLLAGFLALFWWASLRLSMALPMSFAERRFRLFESWPMTKGHARRILLTTLSLIGIVVALEMLVIIVALLGVMIMGVLGAAGMSVFAGVAEFGANLSAFFAMEAIASSIGAIVMVAAYTVGITPIAVIYRDIVTSTNSAALGRP